MITKLNCWRCDAGMEKILDSFQGCKINAWECQKCKEIIYDEKEIQPILKYNKLKYAKHS